MAIGIGVLVSQWLYKNIATWADAPNHPGLSVYKEDAGEVKGDSIDRPILSKSNRGSVEDQLSSGATDQEFKSAQSSESPELKKCQDGVLILEMPDKVEVCHDQQLAEMVIQFASYCSRDSTDESQDSQAYCLNSRDMLDAFLKMLPAYKNPLLLGTPEYPAENFFAGIGLYLETVDAKDAENVIRMGFWALDQVEPSKKSESNLRSWAAYWQLAAPEEAKKWPILSSIAPDPTNVDHDFN
jgi:hypothetical protein